MCISYRDRYDLFQFLIILLSLLKIEAPYLSFFLSLPSFFFSFFLFVFFFFFNPFRPSLAPSPSLALYSPFLLRLLCPHPCPLFFFLFFILRLFSVHAIHLRSLACWSVLVFLRALCDCWFVAPLLIQALAICSPFDPSLGELCSSYFCKPFICLDALCLLSYSGLKCFYWLLCGSLFTAFSVYLCW